MYTILYKKSFEKDLRKLPDKIRSSIYKTILELSKEPRPKGSKKLRSQDNLYRYRVGDYRIIYQIIDEKLIIIIINSGHRKDIYSKI